MLTKKREVIYQMEYYYFNKNIEIKINENVLNDTVKELISSFQYRIPALRFIPVKSLSVSIGERATGSRAVEKDGIKIVADSEKQLLDKLFFALGKAEACFDEKGEASVRIPCGDYSPIKRNGVKMIHLCFFPETKFFVLKRAIRLAGVLGFTHVILEFWGTFPYKCLEELKWKNTGVSLEQVKELLAETRKLKMQPVPMVNHFGHAPGTRVMSGKHTVLDQNPTLSPYFINGGWTWNFKEPKVRKLLKTMRKELCDVFGDGEFFHIGLDESYYDPESEEKREEIYSYVSEICEEIKSEGRRPILWGDLFLHAKSLGIASDEGYHCGAQTKEISDKMLESLPKYAVIADWHYYVKKAPWKTSVYFKEKGFDVIECPWFDNDDVVTAIDTAEEIGSFGIMLTTWHRLDSRVGTPSIYYAGKYLNEKDDTRGIRKILGSTEILRKVYFAGENYEESGWYARQVENICD